MKKIILTLTVLAVTLTLTACAPVIEQLTLIEEIVLDDELTEAKEIPNIGFTTGEVSATSDNIILAASDFADYESEYNCYSSSLHYDTLTDNEKLVYHGLEYAMEHAYSSVIVENSLISSSEELEKILNYLSLDSPLLEQNIFYEYGTLTTYHDIIIDSTFNHQVALEGYYITIENFKQQWWDKKKEAIIEAKKIIEELPPGLSKEETAEQLFINLCRNTEYVYSKTLNATQVMPNLYDALITKKTQCDGFSNALSLLYNMAGITCSEKLYHAMGDELGHTWNFFELNGKWYNADATNASLIPTDRTYMHGGINYGFSDILQIKKHAYSANYPVSIEPLYMPIDGHFTSVTDENVVNIAYDSFNNHMGQWSLLIFDSLDENELEKQMNSLATKLQQSVYYLTFDIVESRTALLIHKENLINYIEP